MTYVHVLGVDDYDYDSARLKFGDGLRPMLGEHTTFSDWAILIDGSSADGDSDVQFEFGVVNAQEVPDRLSLKVGRVGHLSLQVPSSRWQGRDIPAVALFVGSVWKQERRVSEPNADHVLDYWQQSLMEADSLAWSLVEASGLQNKSEVPTVE